MLTFKAHKKAVHALAFSPDGRTLATGAPEEPVRMWDLNGPTEVRQFPNRGRWLVGVAFSPDGRYFARAPDADVWEIGSGARVVGTGGSVLAFAPDGKEAATTDQAGPLARWALPTGKRLPALPGEPAGPEWVEVFPSAVAYSPDGKTLAAYYMENHGTEGPRVVLLNRKTGKRRLEFFADFVQGLPNTLVYSPDGARLALMDGPILGVFDAETGAEVVRLKPGRKHFAGFCFAPVGGRLIALTNDAVARVYDTDTWAETTGYEWQIGKLTAVAIAPDGLRAACGSASGRVIVWDLEV